MITPKQKETIRMAYQSLPNTELAAITGLSIPTIRKYAKLWKLGPKAVYADTKRRRWSPDEIDFLTATSETLSLKERAKRLGRTEMAVAIKTSELNLSHKKMGRPPVTLHPSDMQWLIDNYPYRTNKAIAEHLNLKENSVQYLAKKYGLKKWTRGNNQ